jgi:hypothetical protein
MAKMYAKRKQFASNGARKVMTILLARTLYVVATGEETIWLHLKIGLCG